MSTALENPAEINPFAPPTISLSSVPPETLSANRASQRTLGAVNRLYVVSELAYLATFLSFFLSSCFLDGESALIARIGYYSATILLLCTTVAGLFRAKGFNFQLVLTLFALPLPVVGTIAYVAAKQELNRFMVYNGYLQRFIAFSEDAAERKAMERDPDYRPSLYFALDSSRRKRGLPVTGVLIILGFFGAFLFFTCF